MMRKKLYSSLGLTRWKHLEPVKTKQNIEDLVYMIPSDLPHNSTKDILLLLHWSKNIPDRYSITVQTRNLFKSSF